MLFFFIPVFLYINNIPGFLKKKSCAPSNAFQAYSVCMWFYLYINPDKTIYK